jgi:hypothetical protein
MYRKRERIFDCEFASASGGSRTVVRAWTPAEAAQSFEQALARGGFPGPGRITIRDRTGHMLLEVRAASLPGLGLPGVA